MLGQVEVKQLNQSIQNVDIAWVLDIMDAIYMETVDNIVYMILDIGITHGHDKSRIHHYDYYNHQIINEKNHDYLTGLRRAIHHHTVLSVVFPLNY
jgi:DNA relaxase NicK